MPITLHCESCKKKINAPDDAGGKWGKCPFCNHRCYIPSPPSDNEEDFKLSPIDESAEQKYRQMMKETHNISKALLHQTDEPPDISQDATTEEKELTLRIINYLKLTSEGSLDEAHNLAEKISPYKKTAKAVLDKLLKAKTPLPGLQNIPKKVLEHYIKDMITKMG